LQIVLETPGGLKTERLDADYPEGTPKFVQQDNIDGHHHKPEARTRRLADPPNPELCGEKLRVADLVAWGEMCSTRTVPGQASPQSYERS
jgi:hypothetical protein